MYYYHSHFIDGGTEAQSISFLQNHVINNWWNLNLMPDLFGFKVQTFSNIFLPTQIYTNLYAIFVWLLSEPCILFYSLNAI